nr:D-2-hydroxyacid dehydrogenase [Conyzicola lurida]
MLAQAEVAFDFDWFEPAKLPQNAPNLKWVQGTSSGIGQFVTKTDLGTSDIVFTTASGVHEIPLAEFALTGILHFIKEVPLLTATKARHHWQRYTTRQLAGKRVMVVGLGHVGKRTVGSLTALGVDTVAIGRDGRSYDLPEAGTLASVADMDALLPTVDAIVLCMPLTDETNGMITRERIGLLPEGAILVNIARGGVIDEPAMLEALQSGRLGGAALDVFATEPLPADSPFWELDNVIVSPHSASTVDAENGLITDIFVDNLRRYLDGAELAHVYERTAGY